MPAHESLLLLGVLTFGMLVVPGPSVVFAASRAYQHGARVGLVAVLGLETGLALHVLAAAAGVSQLLVAVPAGLRLLQLAGAGYLVWLGLVQLRRAAPARPFTQAGVATAPPLRKVFLDGLMVDLLNPKTVLFVLALLPQFVRPDGGTVAVQMLLLGLGVVLLAFACDGAYALLAGRLGGRTLPAGCSLLASRGTGVAFLLLAVMVGLG